MRDIIKTSTGDRSPVPVSTRVLIGDDYGSVGTSLAACVVTLKYAPYYDWLMNNSPWSPAFITKTLHEVQAQGYFDFDCDVDAQLMMSAMFSIRTPFLIEPFIDVFNALCERSVHPLTAKAVAYHAYSSTTLGYRSTISTAESNYFLFSASTQQAIDSFLRGEVTISKRATIGSYKERMTYHTTISELFTPSGDVNLIRTLEAAYKARRQPVLRSNTFTGTNPWVHADDALEQRWAALNQQSDESQTVFTFDIDQLAEVLNAYRNT
jgi:hypothetical protein